MQYSAANISRADSCVVGAGENAGQENEWHFYGKPCTRSIPSAAARATRKTRSQVLWLSAADAAVR